MRKHFAVIDIETGPLPNVAQLIEQPKPPGNIKKAETLAEWERTEKPKLIEKAIADAALSPLTGRVLCIGWLAQREEGHLLEFIHDEDEAVMLTKFWKMVNAVRGEAWVRIVGHNIAAFDLPFLIRRSWANNVQPMHGIVDKYGRFDDQFADTMVAWGCGDRTQRISLDHLARLLGVGRKSGNGADFARLWIEGRDMALAYLEHDLRLTLAVAERIL